MATITHKTPTPYYNRRPDWYKGTFKELCHTWGLQAEYSYYLQMEKECAEILAWFKFDFLGVLQWMKQFLIDIKRNAYDKNYVSVYDEAAVTACKVFEKFEGEISATVAKIKQAYDDAVAKAQELTGKVSGYIEGTLKPNVEQAQTQVQEITAYVNGELKTVVAEAKQKADEAKYQAGLVVDQIRKQADQLLNHKGTIDAHTSQIQELFQKLNATPSTPTPTDPTQPKKGIIQEIIDFIY